MIDLLYCCVLLLRTCLFPVSHHYGGIGLWYVIVACTGQNSLLFVCICVNIYTCTFVRLLL